MSIINDQDEGSVCLTACPIDWSDELEKELQELDNSLPIVKPPARKQVANDHVKGSGKSSNARNRRNRKERATNSSGLLVRSSGSPREGYIIHVYIPPLN